MAYINDNYQKLQASYLFSEIARKVSDYQAANPDHPVIKMGIGDVTEPLPEACRNAFHAAIDEMGTRTGFHGYGPEQGYAFLRNVIAENDYQARNCDIRAEEIFISDGSKCDTGNIQEIFSQKSRVAVPDPVYPVYVDTNVMAGRTGGPENGHFRGITYLPCTRENGYIPELPKKPVDLIYLCFPNNPTGATATREELKGWVDYARENNSIILFDAAYESFIRDESIPHSIYEIDGARECAIEFRSFSKSAGFTGTRCAFTVVPEDLVAYDSGEDRVSLHKLWNRRQSTKFNGVSYPVQKAAEAVYSEEGKAQVKALIDFYMKNAALIRKTLEDRGFSCVGGDNAPYIWIPLEGSSWEFFDKILSGAGVVCTPGAGFGPCGEGHIRLSAFNSRENVESAMERIGKVI